MVPSGRERLGEEALPGERTEHIFRMVPAEEGTNSYFPVKHSVNTVKVDHLLARLEVKTEQPTRFLSIDLFLVR